MVYKPFYAVVVTLALLLATIPIAAVWVWQHSFMVVTKIAIVMLWLSTLAYLIYYINKTNRDLAKFVEAFRFRDSSIVFKEPLPKSFLLLHHELNEVVNAFKQVTIGKEKDLIFFQRTIEYSRTGFLAVNNENRIVLCNSSLLELFQLKTLSSIATLQKQFPELHKLTIEIEPGHQLLFTGNINGELKKLAINATEFKSDGQSIKLLTIQDIRNEVDEAELEAWKKLIKVIRHEIHNSVSPITLLASGLASIYEKEGKPIDPLAITPDNVQNTLKGLQAIHKRSKGLSAFVEQYRTLTQLPQPNFQPVDIDNLLNRAILLTESIKPRQNISIIKASLSQMTLLADEKLLEQVVLNLLKNAIEAIEPDKEGRVVVAVTQKGKSFSISISDNGIGMDKTDLEQIFTPFYTTKQNGSGIGLSLSRQIMQLHGGSINASSVKNEGSVFTIIL